MPRHRLRLLRRIPSASPQQQCHRQAKPAAALRLTDPPTCAPASPASAAAHARPRHRQYRTGTSRGAFERGSAGKRRCGTAAASFMVRSQYERLDRARRARVRALLAAHWSAPAIGCVRSEHRIRISRDSTTRIRYSEHSHPRGLHKEVWAAYRALRFSRPAGRLRISQGSSARWLAAAAVARAGRVGLGRCEGHAATHSTSQSIRRSTSTSARSWRAAAFAKCENL